MPHVPGVRTVRKLLVGLGIGLAFITVFSVFALIYLFRLNAVVRHLVFDPVPGSAAIASVAKDFNQYRVLEAMGRRAAESWGMSLTRKAADIERDLKAYDATITQRDDRRRFTELVALWSSYRGLQGETAARSEPAPPAGMALMPARQERASGEINALLTTMIDWNRLEGVRSIVSADSATRAVSATVLSMLVAALILSALALHYNRTVERPMNALAETARSVALGNLDVRATVEGPLEVALVAHELILDDLGLAAALEWQGQQFEQRTHIRCALRVSVDDALDPLVATAMFRICQESLDNVARHSRAPCMTVTLDRCETDLVLEVRDDGVGISPTDATSTRSIGLAAMRERAQLVGGGLFISGTAGVGTTVRVQVPRRETVST